MQNLTTSQIRNMWLDFFKSKDHYEVKSKSLIPYNDESLLFINSGVSTLKDYLSGKETPPSKRLVNSQKSLRTNDIENVGVTSRHHTMFEMLGNFSIGDYFKKEAIQYAWELLTHKQYFAIDKEHLYITVHPNDQQTYELWLEIGVDENHIIKTEENFWEIGKGPGGPNTEIFFDRGEKYDKRKPHDLLKDDIENDRVIEIWNIVFSQYNCNPEVDRTQYKELPQKNIDTGMGLERMACILQEVETNFETDNFKVIMGAIKIVTNTNYDDNKKAYRVIADHIRALTFAISDGVIPSNEGRGYVIRRILRRALKYGYINLNMKEPFLYKLVNAVVVQMADYYPSLKEKEDLIEEIILKEEQSFLKTIKEGIRLFELEVSKIKNNELSGEIVFKLYDTYGFPLELTNELAEEKGIEINITEYNQKLEEQKSRARSARKNISSIDAQNKFINELNVKSEFVGYNKTNTKTIINFITDGQKELQEANKGDEVFITLQKTPFYATSGGQEHDIGYSDYFEVIDVIKTANGIHLHEVKIKSPIKKNQEVEVFIDEKRRNMIQKYHSATHLLHKALEKILGNSVKQAGSSQDDKRTRFDYTYHKTPTVSQIKEIQYLVNQYIKEQEQVQVKQTNLEEAKRSGAKALFDDKYTDDVRVVTMSDSVELCGGTHVNNTSEIESFLITSEQSIGSGIRRIEALVSTDAINYVKFLESQFMSMYKDLENKISNNNIQKLDELNKILCKLEDANEVIQFDVYKYKKDFEILKEQNHKLTNNLNNQKGEKIKELVDEVYNNVKVINNVNQIEYEVEGISNKDLKELADRLMDKIKNGVIILKLIENNKISMVVKVSDSLTNDYNANDIIKEKLKPYNGRGGGKPNMAQGGGEIT